MWMAPVVHEMVSNCWWLEIMWLLWDFLLFPPLRGLLLMKQTLESMWKMQKMTSGMSTVEAIDV